MTNPSTLVRRQSATQERAAAMRARRSELMEQRMILMHRRILMRIQLEEARALLAALPHP